MTLRRRVSGLNYFEGRFNIDKPGWQINGLFITNIVYRTSYEFLVLQKTSVSGGSSVCSLTHLIKM